MTEYITINQTNPLDTVSLAHVFQCISQLNCHSHSDSDSDSDSNFKGPVTSGSHLTRELGGPAKVAKFSYWNKKSGYTSSL